MKILIVISLIFISAGAAAQPFSIRGMVSADGQPLRAASVSLHQTADSGLVKSALSNADGSYLFQSVKSGNYFLRLSYTGYTMQQSAAFVLRTDTLMAIIDLLPSSRQLDAVTVTATRPMIEVLADKTVFNVSSSLAATGTNGMELLRKAPGIVIDNQDNILVEGKTGVAIYIDGRPSALSGPDLTAYLKSLNAADIETVEIITQPSSRFDAAGNAGIVNIRMKKNRNYGTNGSLSAGYARGRYGKFNTGFNLNNRNASTNTYVAYTTQLGTNRSFINLYRLQSGMIYDSRSFSVSDDRSHTIRAGADLSLNNRHSIGFLLNGNLTSYDNQGNTRTPLIDAGTMAVQSVLNAAGHTLSSNRNLGANVNYRYVSAKNTEFSVDFDAGNYRASRNSTQPNTYYNPSENQILSQSNYRMLTPVNIGLLSAKADLGTPLLKGRFSTGIKSSAVSTSNSFSYYRINGSAETLDNNRSSLFDYTETIHAVYVNYARNFKKTDIQFGIRAEQTVSSAHLLSLAGISQNRVRRNYFNFFPSGGITWRPDPKNTFSLLYSSRIERPGYRSLNPFEWNIDELSFSKGNPFLRPQLAQNIKLSHTYKYTLNTSLSYSFIRDFFAQITDTLSQNRNFISPQNIANQQVLNLGISYPFKVNSWWNVYASVNASGSSYASRNEKFVPVSQSSLSVYGQNTFNLPAKLQLEVSGWYNTPSIWGGTYRTKSLGSLDLALQKTFFSNRLSARLSASDVLFTSNWYGNTRYGALAIRGNGGYESRQLRFNLGYTFGRNEIRTPRRRNSAVEDENRRMNN